jgi:hypothetical protein
MFICRLRLAQPLTTEKENTEQLHLLNCLHSEKQEHVSPVKVSCPSLRTTAPPCLTLDIKDSLKENMRLFAFALGAFLLWGLFCFGVLFWGFWALGFLVRGAFGREKNF